jgi:hypothetical protein
MACFLALALIFSGDAFFFAANLRFNASFGASVCDAVLYLMIQDQQVSLLLSQ